MAKEKVTLTLDAQARAKHLSAVDQWLGELENVHGPVPPESLEWASRIVDDWARRGRRE